MLRFAPLACMSLFVVLGIGWRTWHQWRRHGTTGIVLFRSGRPAQHVRDALLVALGAAVGGEALLAAVAPAALAAFGRVPGLGGPVCVGVGAGVVLAATGAMVASQLHLGASWRIGIDEGARPGLVTDGFYRWCRNPIFLFMLAALAGFAVMLPNWLSLGMLAASYVGIRLQVGEEEAYLLRTYGEDYGAYARRVGRFVPGVGRLR